MKELSDLISLAETMVKKTRKKVDEIEWYISSSFNIEVEIQGGVVTTKEGEFLGASTRVGEGKRIGVGAISNADTDQLLKMTDRVIQIARVKPDDPDFHHFPDPVCRPSTSGIWDEEILSLDAGYVAQKAHEHVLEAQSVEGITFVEGSIKIQSFQYGVANSRGINVGDGMTFLEANIHCKASKGGPECTGMEAVFSRSLVPLDGIGQTAAQRARDFVDAREAGVGEAELILDNYTASFPIQLLNYGISSKSVQEQRSALIGKVGTHVGSDILSVEEDPFLLDGMQTRKFDDEGIPPTRKEVIRKGVLNTFLHNSYTAHKEGIESTGNGMRGYGQAYSVPPYICPTNMVIEPGKSSLDDMVADVELGILVKHYIMGLYNSNYLTGDFNIIAPNAYLVKNGEIACPLTPTIIAGNIYDLLPQIDAIGKDTRIFDGGKVPALRMGVIKFTSLK